MLGCCVLAISKLVTFYTNQFKFHSLTEPYGLGSLKQKIILNEMRAENGSAYNNYSNKYWPGPLAMSAFATAIFFSV